MTDNKEKIDRIRKTILERYQQEENPGEVHA